MKRVLHTRADSEKQDSMDALAVCHPKLTRSFQSMDHGNTILYTSLTTFSTPGVSPNLSLQVPVAGWTGVQERQPSPILLPTGMLPGRQLSAKGAKLKKRVSHFSSACSDRR